MKKIELLSPAGDFESLKSAIHAGCDAIYLGGKKFGARAFSKNFDNDEMIEAINYAHLYGVKVYVTINTIIYENEIDEVINYIDFLHKNKVDAILLQDLGLVDIVRKIFPNLEIHASTQMNIHTVKQLKLMKELGFKRVVLGREVDLDTIKKMKEEVDIEIEVFIHGALCVSASGECLMSYMIGKRSANRGECAGACRQKYYLYKDNKKIDLKDEYLLSTKDLCLIDKLDDLIGLVDSLKIEGRMKSKDYVSLVTNAYRKKIDKKYNNEIEDVKKVFYRGFTLGNMYNQKGKQFINGERPNHLGYLIGEVIDYKKNKVFIKLNGTLNQFDGIRFDQKEEVGFIVNKLYKNKNLVSSSNKEIINLDCNKEIKVGTKVYKTLEYKLDYNFNKKVLIEGEFKTVNKDIYFTVTDGINKEEIVLKNIVEVSKNNPLSIDNVKEKLSKLGNTPYEFSKLDINIDNNIFIPVSVLNNLRRDIIDKLSNDRINVNNNYKRNEYKLDLNNIKEDNIISFEVSDINQLEYILNNTNYNIYVDNYLLYLKYKNNDRVFYKKSRMITNEIKVDKECLSGEISSIKDNVLDTYFNVVNSYALGFLFKMGAKRISLSYELDMLQTKELYNAFVKRYNQKPNLEVVIYGKPEVMISKYCVLNTYLGNQNKTNCNLCKSNDYYLVDRFNNKYRIKPSFDCLMRIEDYKNIDLIDRINNYREIGINSFRIILSKENSNEIKDIIDRIR